MTKHDVCPICGSIPIFVSRDLFKKSRCSAGHKWHTCLVHNQVNIDWPATNNMASCTCSDRKEDNDIHDLNTQQVLEALSIMHTPDKWAFFDELRIGTGYGKDNEQRLDAWAIHYFPSKKNLVRCYEIKVSRSDFFHEIQKPKKRRAGLRLSNEFWFVTPKNLVAIHEVPPECGLLEVDSNYNISTKIRAPYRNTVPPTFLFLASICRRSDKDRNNAFEKLKQIVDNNYNELTATQSVLKDHIAKWENYNQGNKEVPDKIAKAIKMVLYDIEKEKEEFEKMRSIVF